MSVLAKSVHFHTLSASCSFTVFPVFTSTVHPYNIQFRTALSICNEKKPTMLSFGGVLLLQRTRIVLSLS